MRLVRNSQQSRRQLSRHIAHYSGLEIDCYFLPYFLINFLEQMYSTTSFGAVRSAGRPVENGRAIASGEGTDEAEPLSPEANGDFETTRRRVRRPEGRVPFVGPWHCHAAIFDLPRGEVVGSAPLNRTPRKADGGMEGADSPLWTERNSIRPEDPAPDIARPRISLKRTCTRKPRPAQLSGPRYPEEISVSRDSRIILRTSSQRTSL